MENCELCSTFWNISFSNWKGKWVNKNTPNKHINIRLQLRLSVEHETKELSSTIHIAFIPQQRFDQ